MSSTNDKRNLLWAAVLLAALVTLPAASQAAPPEVATMSALGNFVSWSPNFAVSYDKLVLRVSGGGFSSQQEFGPGESPQFVPVDDEGYVLQDGAYSWELTVIPRAADLNDANFRSEEVSADGRAVKAAEAPAGLKQSGTFTVLRGSIVDPNLVEEESSARAAAEAVGEAAEVDDSDAANN